MANTQRGKTTPVRRRKKKKNNNNYLYIALAFGFVAIVLFALIIALSVNNDSGGSDLSDISGDITSADNSDNSQDVSNGGSENDSNDVSDGKKTGWTEENGNKYYYDENGVMSQGVTEIDGSIYVFNAQGIMEKGGFVSQSGSTYYLAADGRAHTGWLEQGGNSYYFDQDGVMAVGETLIDDKKYFFSTTGIEFAVANPWNSVCSSTEECDVDLVTLPNGYGDSVKGKVDRSIYDDLMQMMDDCYNTTGRDVYVISGHRTYNYQKNNYEGEVKYYLGKGYSQENAEKAAAEWVAPPGTSEHHLGLAVDIIDTEIWNLVEEQETLEGQQWLMENCWKYGFILRYPKDGKASTGINYEPWHYRYLGKELAKEVYESGMTLEDYIDNISK